MINNFVGGYNINKKVINDTFQHYSLNFIFHNTQPPPFNYYFDLYYDLILYEVFTTTYFQRSLPLGLLFLCIFTNFMANYTNYLTNCTIIYIEMLNLEGITCLRDAKKSMIT